jgi:anthranilate phosphoribosyltransferase
MLTEAIEKVKQHKDLTEGEMTAAFGEIMSGAASPGAISLFLAALRAKGETVDEITAAAKVMRQKSLRVDVGGETVLDTCGTGGTGISTFNISTTAAFVVAGCAVKVAKHGNRTASRRCGSADVLEALGVRIDITPGRIAGCIREIGIGFIFAPMFHTAMKYAAAPRRELGGKTIFNLLGPLSNPALATLQVVGVYDAKLTETVAGVLNKLGTERAFVVAGADGLDEITITGKTVVSELTAGRVKTYYVEPASFGLRSGRLEDIKGAGPEENASAILSILKGESGPRRDIVLANASAGLVCAGRAKDIVEGVKLAAESIDSGAAFEKLSALIEMTNR